ncbi:MAG: hypothetical protein LBL44_01545 [Treponema sp.]|jgi:hypothetical protein|nr:hypothetical protein [Treponema sp.]
MKKRLYALSAALLFLAILTACQQAVTGTIGAIGGRKWTFVVYMAADNDLEAAAIADFNELEGAAVPGNAASILALLDRAPGYDATNGNWTDTRLFEVRNDPNGVNATIVSKRLSCPELGLSSDMETELDMSDPLVLSRLLAFAKRVYPAENYGLLVWGHGTGWRSGGTVSGTLPEPLKAVAFDDTSTHFMGLPSLGEAVSGQGLSVIAFDTCFGALLEIAYQIRNSAEWFVGSEGVIPSTGWNYAGLFTSFLQKPFLLPGDFCDSAMDQFIGQYSGVAGSAISKIKLSEVSALFSAFETFSGTLARNITSIPIRDAVLTSVLTTVESYYFTSYPSDLYIDIYDFSQKMIAMRTSITSDPLEQNAISVSGTLLQSALQNAVPSSWAKNGTTMKLGVHVIPLQAASVPRSSHEGEYINGSASLGKSAFVENSVHWVPHAVPQTDSFLDKLFY